MNELKSKEEYYNKPGQLKNLVEEISSTTNMEYVDVVRKIPSWIKSLPENEQVIIRRHYFQNYSITEIIEEFNLESNEELYNFLESKKSYFKKLANDESQK